MVQQYETTFHINSVKQLSTSIVRNNLFSCDLCWFHLFFISLYHILELTYFIWNRIIRIYINYHFYSSSLINLYTHVTWMHVWIHIMHVHCRIYHKTLVNFPWISQGSHLLDINMPFLEIPQACHLQMHIRVIYNSYMRYAA